MRLVKDAHFDSEESPHVPDETQRSIYLESSQHDIDRALARGILLAIADAHDTRFALFPNAVLESLWRLATNGEYSEPAAYELSRMADNVGTDIMEETVG